MGRLIVLIFILIVLGGPIALGLTRPETVPASALPEYSGNPDNGRTMFLAGGCASCHAAPNQDDATQLGGGREIVSDCGTFRAPNISPHRRDGIGSWSEAAFVNAMLKGTSPSNEHYYPAFPYTSYSRMTVADVRDLFAFLRTLPAVEGRAPAHELTFPFSVRAGIGFWKLLYFDEAPAPRDDAKSAHWNRGAYLIEGPGHCAECHSPRDFLGGIVTSQRMAGGPNPAGQGAVPNITQQPDGIADWTEDDIVELLGTGVTPEFDKVSGDMALVVRNTGQLLADDRRAMAHYLKSLAPVPAPPRN
ncbi:MAG TPA: cytochrome c [Xanthobacteraceae bacterium]|nr:cytochrome c [Xanthobacteraceae bacterium]